MTNWFYQLEGKEAEGPISSTRLKELAKDGILKPTDLIWNDGYQKWVKAKRLKGLFSLEEGKDLSINTLKSDNSKKKQNPVSHRNINEPRPKADIPKWEVKKLDGNIYLIYHNRDLKRLVSYGELKPSNLVRKCGKIKWHKASEIKGLFEEQKGRPNQDTIDITRALAPSTQDNAKHAESFLESENSTNAKKPNQEKSDQTLISPTIIQLDVPNVKFTDSSFTGKQKTLFCLVSFLIFSCCVIPSWIDSLRKLPNSLKQVKETAAKFEGYYEEIKENGINQITVFIDNHRKPTPDDIEKNNEERRAANTNLRLLFGQGLATIDPEGFLRKVNEAEYRVYKAENLIINGTLALQESDFRYLLRDIENIIQHDSFHVNLKVRLGRMFTLKSILDSRLEFINRKDPNTWEIIFKRLKSFTILIPTSIAEIKKIDKSDLKEFQKKHLTH